MTRPTAQLMTQLTTAKAVCLSLGLMAMLSAAGCSSQTAQKSGEKGTEATEQPAAETAKAPAGDASEASPAGGARAVENLQLTPGPDPMAIVLTTRQPSTEPTGSEQIKLSYPSANKAVVVVTKTGLADDSVAATRTRYEFAPVEGAAGAKQWQLTQATEQNKCQADRGSREWTGELCK